MKQTILELVTELSARDTKTLSQKTLKLMEEAGELAKVVLPYEGAAGCNHRFPDKDKIAEECADVMLVAFSIASSMGVSSEDIFKMVGRKANYWKHLMEQEDAVDLNNLMFEMHVTVSNVKNLEKFKKDCEWLHVKPIILDLYTKGGKIDDIMTSSHYRGSTVGAATYSRQLVSKLKAIGYHVVREKIETVPWHPASRNAHMSPDSTKYFEAHLAFPAYTSGAIFEAFIAKNNIHLSKNQMKKGNAALIMGTYRRSSMDVTSIQFQAALDAIIAEAEILDFELVEKPVIEYALYDSNSKHDSEWIEA